MTDARTDDELRATIAEGERARDALNQRLVDEGAAVQARVDRTLRADRDAAFRPDELRFAAHDRCTCGAGYAYPKRAGLLSAWHCAAILQGKAAPGSEHSPALPFAFYELKSEDQPSAGGATTRGADERRG